MMTAVEWLLNEWQTLETTLPNSLIEKVLEMEKQQLNDAYNADRPNLTCYEENTAFEEYYNETFNNED
jgi:hypothetical protein